MLNRKIYSDLLEWKGRSHKCLVISGQRQVGKTYIIREFGKNEYDHFVEINLSDDIESRSVFGGNLSAEEIIKRLMLYRDPDEFVPGRTLIFFDEIQECPEAYSSLKSFTISGKYDIIASGSLMGVNIPNLNKGKGTEPLIPMGYEERLTMHSMDFEEFLWAKKIPKETIAEVRSDIKGKKQIDHVVYDRFASLFRDFMIVGGMPEAVQAFVGDGNYKRAGIILENIIASCRRDINRYNSGIDKIKTEECFDSVPGQLSMTNKKFMYSRIRGEGSRMSSDKYMENLLWIKNAGYGNFCYGLEQPALPLTSNVKRDCFKVYLSDTGMLMHMYGGNSIKAIFENNTSYNIGAIVENVTAECLMKCGYRIYYYEKRKGINRMELDFILETGDGIVAAEVKSGKDRVAPSIEKVSAVFKIGRRVMFEDSNISVGENGIEHYPLFVSAFFDETEPEWNGPAF
ncbi:MAG: ATP-binding protein [Candidatus Methanoplasma sp.]|jgi:predicted AAA+ superfamily ATPase|nr:ATP-binding protein [Candidatus Methanoplasma sp.]